eukprot:scaffold2973_cov67-Cylindrotheca_fusiformis.AAC.3
MRPAKNTWESVGWVPNGDVCVSQYAPLLHKIYSTARPSKIPNSTHNGCMFQTLMIHFRIGV